MFCHITKDALNVIKILIINALPKLQLLPFCFVGHYSLFWLYWMEQCRGTGLGKDLELWSPKAVLPYILVWPNFMF